MRHRRLIAGCLAIAAAGLVSSLSASGAAAQDTIKIGIVVPMTGTSGAVGREISDAAHLYMAQHGDTVAGKKIELIVKDDQSVPDNAKRLAQEMVVNDHVNFLGAGLTPSAMAMAPIATEGKVPSPKSRPITCAPASRLASSPASSPIGRSRTVARKPS